MGVQSASVLNWLHKVTQGRTRIKKEPPDASLAGRGKDFKLCPLL